jgi:uncharacterized membrane protein YraQ (UPF0718 family)
VNLALIASLAALVVGPLVFERTRGPWALAALDAFALVAVGGLVSVHILPQCFEQSGWLAAPALALGLFGPGLLCGSRLLSGRTGSRITLPLALLGIALHALLDGVALGGSGETLDALALAIVLHRVSDGLGIWWLARPAYGKPTAMALLGTLALFSVVGFVLRPEIVAGTSQPWFWLLQALIAGSLLHVILRHPPSAPRASAGPGRGTALASGAGGLLGLALVLALESFVEADPHAHGGGALFVELALQSAPALLAAYLLVALLHASELDLRKWLGGGSRLSQALRGTLVGLPMPICSCGVIPLYRGLVQQGAPATAALAFLVSAPELSITAVFLSASLLGFEVTLARALAAGVLALVVGLVVGARLPRAPTTLEPEPARVRRPLGVRLAAGLRYGLGDMVDATAPWILVGLGVSALLEPWISAEGLAGVAPALEVPLFALLGMPLYVCASGSTPLAAVLIAKGVSPGAAIAFLLTGPATNLTTFGLLTRLHSRGTALLFALTTALTTMALGWGANAFLGHGRGGQVAHPHGHEVGTLELGCALALIALCVVSILRQGTRRFVGQVISPHGAESLHDHDHDHDHDHGDPHDGPAHGAAGCCEAPARP